VVPVPSDLKAEEMGLKKRLLQMGGYWPIPQARFRHQPKKKSRPRARRLFELLKANDRRNRLTLNHREETIDIIRQVDQAQSGTSGQGV